MTTNYISEDYCSEEISSLLEEHGYIGATNTYLDKDGFRVKEITLQSAMKWLRKVHNICIFIWPGATISKFNACVYYDNYIHQKIQHKFEIITRDENVYEKACESAIKYCLENLI